MLTAAQLRLAYARFGEQVAQVECLEQAVGRDDPTYTQAVIIATCNAAASAGTQLVTDIDLIKAASCRKVADRDPRTWSRVPRCSDGELPRVRSAEA